jgi:hypothetical protein
MSSGEKRCTGTQARVARGMGVPPMAMVLHRIGRYSDQFSKSAATGSIQQRKNVALLPISLGIPIESHGLP